MRNILLILLGLATIIASCEPNIAPPPVVKYTTVDTIPERDTVIPEVKIFRLSLVDSAGIVKVKATDFETQIPIQGLYNVKFKLSPEKELVYLRVNDKTFIGREDHTYRYNSSGDVIVSQGDLVERICVDHDITVEQFKKLNPSINVDKLKLNQIVHVAHKSVE